MTNKPPNVNLITIVVFVLILLCAVLCTVAVRSLPSRMDRAADPLQGWTPQSEHTDLRQPMPREPSATTDVLPTITQEAPPQP